MTPGQPRKINGKWCPVFLNVDGKWVPLGEYDTYEEAQAAYVEQVTQTYGSKGPPADLTLNTVAEVISEKKVVS